MRSFKVLWEKTGKNCTIVSKKCAGQRRLRSHKTLKKAKAFWKMKAAKDSGEDFYDPDRKDNILGRNKTRLELW